jgi:threonine/homoserine/homoserine lactone efflux protein
MMTSLVAFAGVSVILAVTPGPDSLLVLRGSLRGGWRSGTRVAAGAASGSLVWGILAAAGLATILAGSAQIFRVVQLLGAAYLVFLGIRGWQSGDGHGSPHPAGSPGFRTGLFGNLLNPKIGLFFLAVMPQFIPHGSDVTTYALAFAAADALIAATWLAVVAWLGDGARSMLDRPRVRRAVDRAAGAVLVALGLGVIAERMA